MVDLSIGQVSGLIAVGIFTVQLFFPLSLPAILVAFLTEENSAVTWSVLGRYLHSSHWPTILQTDTVASAGVRRRVIVTSWVQTGALFLVTIASILTPLGLYDNIEPQAAPTQELFTYVRDSSAFGYGTPARPDAPFTRVCGDYACPGQTLNQTCNHAGNNCSVVYDPVVPESLIDLFGNGSAKIGPSVSSMFDIQWRTYVNGTDIASSLGWYLRAAYQQLSVLILDEKVEPVEGLVVDMVSGGIGFRNHTAPLAPLTYGGTWTEDILFIEPETQCVDLNVTVDFLITTDFTAVWGFQNLTLTDRGGLSGLSRSQPDFPSANGQTDLNLAQRAYAAAWLNNFLTLAFYNATNPDPSNITHIDVALGQKLSVPGLSNSTDATCNATDFGVAYNGIMSSINYGGYLNVFADNGNGSSPGENGINGSSFSTITSLCAGTSAFSSANINGSVVGCSLLYGAPNRTDGGSSLVGDPGSPWSIPMYSCATAIKATIRTVTFQYNGTGIAALNITSAIPKVYSDSSSLPLWGVETLPDDIDLAQAQPLWGILGTANSTGADLPPPSTDNISTVAQESLYLPGFMNEDYEIMYGASTVPGGTAASVNTGQNLPGVDFYSRSLWATLNVPGPCSNDYWGGADYSGRSSLALFARWQRILTAGGAASAGSIIDLIWTDAAANAVLGTRGWGLSARSWGEGGGAVSAEEDEDVQVPIIVYTRVIRYRLPFAVPAMVVLGAVVVVLTVLVVLVLVRRTGTGRMRRFLEDTSAGRIIALGLWKERAAVRGTRQWVAAVGRRSARVYGDGTIGEGQMLLGDESAGGQTNGDQTYSLVEYENPDIKKVSDREGISVDTTAKESCIRDGGVIYDG